MISAVITAAGKNRRMIEDLKSRGMDINHKLLMSINEKPIIIHTIDNVLKSGVDECTIVLGHFSNKISSVLKEFNYEQVKIVENPNYSVELSQTLLNGIQNFKPSLCLCVAADQPTVTSKTFKKIIAKASQYENPENIVSILARKKDGYLKSAEGLGMPFVCHTKLLLKYLLSYKGNLNPILRKMMVEGVVFYGNSPINNLELLNINRYEDYLYVKDNF